MLKILIVTKSIKKVAFITTLMLATITTYSSKTLAQVPSTPSRTNSQSGCLSGYPNDTYRGDRPVTRYEFAAGMNACLERINQLLPNEDNTATREDFEALIQRQQELNEQVRELNSRVGNPPKK